MFQYSSEQTHFTMKNGKKVQITERVNVENGKGTMTVLKVHNGKKAIKAHPLTQKQIRNIESKKFMPGLFRPCLDGCDKELGLPLEMTTNAKKTRKRHSLHKSMKKRSKTIRKHG
jgi:hypothetical protein